MAARENSPFSAEHIAEFNRIQALRPVMLRRVTDLLEIWRCCANKTCKRSRGCQRDDGACLATFMQAIPDSERRLFRYTLDNRSRGLAPDAAMKQAQARVDDETARFGE